MKKKIIVSAIAGVFAIGAFTFVFADFFAEPPTPRKPAAAPGNYETLRACDKQALLWEKVQQSVHAQLPPVRKFGLLELISLGRQEISIKGKVYSDFAPAGWKKHLHGRGAMAKVKIVPHSHKYTGVFQGAECGLLRLSLTYKPDPVAPGLALKILRDHVNSANVSALVSLYGQEDNYNFFEHPMSNIVPVGKDFGQKRVHEIFKKVSNYPEELMLSDMAHIGADGQPVARIVTGRQIFFVPSGDLKFASSKHDVREDFLKIPEGTLIYKIMMVTDSKFDYSKFSAEDIPGLLQTAEHIADIVSTSEFIASEFGDDGIFFRHQLRP